MTLDNWSTNHTKDTKMKAFFVTFVSFMDRKRA